MDLSSNLILSLEEEKFSKLFSIIKRDNPLREFDISTKEQICFRMYLCVDCYESKKCKFCKCNPEDTLIEPYSCNKSERFPNLMNQWKWEEYKRINKIVFK